MSNPHVTVSLFKIRTKKALVKMSYTADAYGENGNNSMGAALLDIIKHMNGREARDGVKIDPTPHYMSFTRYTRNHKKDQIEECTAIMLEYPYKVRAELMQRLESFPYAHYAIDTQADFTVNAEARILIAFPVEEAITSPSDYTRIASLLWDEIGIDAHTKGDISSTFLFAPYTVNPSVRLYDADRIYLNPSEYLDAHCGSWVDARHHLNELPARSGATANDESGMFYFPGQVSK